MPRNFFAAVVIAAAVSSIPAPAQQVVKRQGVKEAAADIAKAVLEAAAAEKLAGVRVGKFTPINIDPDTAGLTPAAGSPGAAPRRRGSRGFARTGNNAKYPRPEPLGAARTGGTLGVFVVG